METLWRKLMLVSTILPHSYYNYHQFVHKPEPDNSIIVNIKQCCPQIISKISNTAIVVRLKHRNIALNDESATCLSIELLGQQKSKWKKLWVKVMWLVWSGGAGVLWLLSGSVLPGHLPRQDGNSNRARSTLRKISDAHHYWYQCRDFSEAKLRNTKLCFGQKQCSGFFC